MKMKTKNKLLNFILVFAMALSLAPNLMTNVMAEDISNVETPNAQQLPTVEVNLPEKVKVGETLEFDVSTNANDYKDTMVIGTSKFDGPAIEKIEYYEVKDGQWYELKDNEFGPATGFPLGDFTSEFRVTFAEAGEANFTIYIKDVATGEVLASVEKTLAVEEKVAPTVEVNLPEKVKVGETLEFDVSTNANDYKDTMVIGTSKFDGPAIEKIEYYEVKDGQWYELKDNEFGPATGFPLGDFTSEFRVTFAEAGEANFTIYIKDVATGEVLASVEKTLAVEEKVAPIEPEQDMIKLTLKAVLDGKVLDDLSQTIPFPKGYEFTADDIAELNKALDEALKDQDTDGYVLKGIFLDKEGTKELKAGYGFDVDTTIYMVWEKEGEIVVNPTPDKEQPNDKDNQPTPEKDKNDAPKTDDDSNITLYASFAALAVVGGAIIVLNKKREELMK